MKHLTHSRQSVPPFKPLSPATRESMLQNFGPSWNSGSACPFYFNSSCSLPPSLSPSPPSLCVWGGARSHAYTGTPQGTWLPVHMWTWEEHLRYWSPSFSFLETRSLVVWNCTNRLTDPWASWDLLLSHGRSVGLLHLHWRSESLSLVLLLQGNWQEI